MKAVSFDIGWMENIGVIAETEAYQRQREYAADMQKISDTELLALLTIYCDPRLPVLTGHQSQLLIGVRTPADFLAEGQDPPEITNRPLFNPFSRGAIDGGLDSTTARFLDVLTLLKLATEPEEKIEVITDAIRRKLARALSIVSDDVELTKPLSHYGVDSLMAVELRNWINKDFQVNVNVFDIMGGIDILAIANMIVTRMIN